MKKNFIKRANATKNKIQTNKKIVNHNKNNSYCNIIKEKDKKYNNFLKKFLCNKEKK